jgi:hypothetical protein
MRGLGNYQISVPKRPVGSEDRNLLAFQNNNFWFYRNVPVPVQSLVISNGENLSYFAEKNKSKLNRE